jgi:hypothetical protein
MYHVWESGEMLTGFWWENLKEIDHMEEPNIDGRRIRKRIFRKCDGRMDWIDLAQDRDRWQALVNVVINLPVP